MEGLGFPELLEQACFGSCPVFVPFSRQECSPAGVRTPVNSVFSSVLLVVTPVGQEGKGAFFSLASTSSSSYQIGLLHLLLFILGQHFLILPFSDLSCGGMS